MKFSVKINQLYQTRLIIFNFSIPLTTFFQKCQKTDRNCTKERDLEHATFRPSDAHTFSSLTFFRQTRIVPSAKQIQLVPFALAMTNHNNSVFRHFSQLFLDSKKLQKKREQKLQKISLLSCFKRIRRQRRNQ